MIYSGAVFLSLCSRNVCISSEKRIRFSFRSDICHFVRSGLIFPNGGYLDTVGEKGYYWLGSHRNNSNQNYAKQLAIYKSIVVASLDHQRYWPFPLRCLVR